MSTLSRIATMVPVDRKAAMTTARGVHWTPAKEIIKPWDARDENILPVRPYPAINPPAHNLAGSQVGRLFVVGLSAEKKGGRWVVRCACGAYEHRRTKFLQSENAKTRAMCNHCDYLSELKKGLVP